MPNTANTPPPGKTHSAAPGKPPAHPATPAPEYTTGAELQTLREAAGLSREALAELVGVQARTVKHWESGRAGVPADVASVALRLADWVANAAHRLRMQARKTYHGQISQAATTWSDDGEPLHMQLMPGTAPARVVLVRYRETSHMHASTAPNGTTADTHGAAVTQAMQGLALDGIPARVVWFDPDAFYTWRSAHQAEDTPASRALWAQASALPAQAIPPRGEQPPPDFTPGYGAPSTGTTRGRSRP